MGLSSNATTTTFESGSFTLSADGSTATLGMNGEALVATNHKVTFDMTVTSATDPVVGDVITDATTGATGTVVSFDGTTVVLDTIDGVAATWTNTNALTWGAAETGTIDTAPTWIITIPTQKKLKQGFFNVKFVDGAKFSVGQSDGVINNCITYGAQTTPSQTNCISAKSSTTGWTATISSNEIHDTNFEIPLIQSSGGLIITGQFHLQEL